MGRKRSSDNRKRGKEPETVRQREWRIKQLEEKRRLGTMQPKNYREFEKLQETAERMDRLR